jgi:hypothetical protein
MINIYWGDVGIAGLFTYNYPLFALSVISFLISSFHVLTLATFMYQFFQVYFLP